MGAFRSINKGESRMKVQDEITKEEGIPQQNEIYKDSLRRIKNESKRGRNQIHRREPG
jgi:hypothetical protein